MKRILYEVEMGDMVIDIAERVSSILAKSSFNHHSEDLLTCKEVEAILDISPPTRIAWTRNGALKAYALGSRKYYKRSDIDTSLIPIR